MFRGLGVWALGFRRLGVWGSAVYGGLGRMTGFCT